MIRDAQFEALGLSEDASPAQICETIARKQVQLEQAWDKAPTDALRKKYQQQLQKLEQLAAELAPEPKAGTAGPSSLSQTKLADLPQSATQFGGAQTAQVNLREGQILANRYEIKEQIGAGGMGAVYRALDKTTGKEIALKVLLPALLKNERARERFLDEARISQQLSHPYIVNVFDVQQDGDFFFLTMELLEGQDLRQVMENRKLARQPFEVEEVLEILDPLCEALAYAHEYTVHHDIKPENIWIGEDGKLKVMDFGIARVQSASQRTQTGAAMGTAYYMAPEQLKGRKNIDGRADLYSMAVMAYELLSGEVPAGMIEPLQTQRKGISRKLAQAIHQGLATKPENRFADIKAFRAALQHSAKGGIELNLPWKGIGIAAGVLVAILGIGGLAASGSFGIDSLKSLLPMSKEEIAAQKASLAKIQGEIKVLKQRLESARRSLDSDVRDAERRKSSELAALQHWQRLTEDGIFAGSKITELEGDLSMAETLLRDESFEQARPVFERVRSGYAELQQQFDSAGELLAAEQVFDRAQGEWQKLKKDYGLNDPAPVAAAQDIRARAQQQQRQGDFPAALASWQVGAQQWHAARSAVVEDVARIDQKREAQAAAAERAAAERARILAEKRRQSLAGTLEYHKAQVGLTVDLSDITTVTVKTLREMPLVSSTVSRIYKTPGMLREELVNRPHNGNGGEIRGLKVRRSNSCRKQTMSSWTEPQVQECEMNDFAYERSFKGDSIETISPLLAYDLSKVDAKYVGREVNPLGGKCDVIEIVSSYAGEKMLSRHFINVSTGLIEKTEYSDREPLDKIDSYVVYEDYREHEGVQLSFRQKLYLPGESAPYVTTSLQEFFLNKPVENNTFSIQ